MKCLITIFLASLILLSGCVNTSIGKPVTISNFILAEYMESLVNIEEKNNALVTIMTVKINLKNLGEEQDCINKFLLEDAQGKIYEQQKIIFKNSENNNQICLESSETAELTVFFEISPESEFYKLTHQNKNLTNELIKTIKLSQNKIFLCNPLECEKESKTFCDGTTKINAYCSSENICVLETTLEENSVECGYIEEELIDFPEDQLIDKDLSEVVLSRVDLSSKWQEKDSWGKYKSDLAMEVYKTVEEVKYCNLFNVVNEEKHEQCATVEIGSFIAGIVSIVVQKNQDIESSKEDCEAEIKVISSNPRTQKVTDRIKVGNEMVSAEYSVSNYYTNKWTYTVIFRRNNIITKLKITKIGSLNESEYNKLRQEIENYALLIDQRLTN